MEGRIPQVIVGRAKLTNQLRDNIIIRKVHLSFARCTKEGDELIEIAEEAFDKAFQELHQGLNPRGAIFRYEFDSSALKAEDIFGFQEEDFKPATHQTLMRRIMRLIDSHRAINIFRSVMKISMIYIP